MLNTSEGIIYKTTKYICLGYASTNFQARYINILYSIATCD